jgi:hypothetical protein
MDDVFLTTSLINGVFPAPVPEGVLATEFVYENDCITWNKKTKQVNLLSKV